MSESASNRPRHVPPAPAVTDFGDDFEGTERFEIVRKLGAGGMGVVYEAYDREREARVALKTLRTLKPDALLRFKNEFRALQDIHHPNLVSLGELFEEEGRWFFTMEMVDGEHFLDYVAHIDEPDPSISVQSSGESMLVSLPGESTVGGPASPDAPTVDIPGDASSSHPTRPSHVAPRSARGPLASGVDERRLRSALAQLALGLAALHRAEKVHRDIKPSNILVTREGQVKILDFGLIADLRSTETESHLVGTFSYMAPEQAGLRQVGPAADWYSVGVLIYKAITGRLPVTGGAREVLVLKQAFEPAPPSALNEVPEDLDILCVDLLRIDPAARPSEREILERLNARDVTLPGGGQLTHFVGRRMELAALGKAFAVARKTRGVTFFVHGESGVGKSALVRRFTEGLAKDPGAAGDAPPSPAATGDTSGAVVFFGRCYERENVPYKGVDGIVDALSRYLSTLDPASLAAVLPRQAGLVGQVFPVMRRIDAVAQAPKPAAGALDPQILRARLFFALRELFLRLAHRAPLVLVIDDLQWADADSLALLAEIMRPPDAPRLLLLATMRNVGTAREGAAPARSVAEVAALFSGDVRQIDIESLPRDEAQALVAALLFEAGEGAGVDVAQIADAASGHPLFIDELVRRRLTAGADAGPLKLDEALWARVEKLEAGARALLEIVAVAGVPIAQETATLAIKTDLAELVRRVGVLRGAHLVRTAGVRRSDTIEPYHDRVREAVLLHIGADARSRCHGRLALALEADGRADPEALATHWRGAGHVDKALVYALRAAGQAEEALAFDRAARLYKLSIDLRSEVGAGAEKATMYARLGDALANAGRGAEAAQAFLASVAESPSTTSGDTILDLRRKATEQLLRSGLIDEGIAELGVVLATIDIELPKTPARALASLLVRRAQVRLRGVGFRERRAAEISPDLLQRVDVCWSASIVLGMVDNLRGADFQARGLLLALEAGEPFRVARALAAEACFASVEGGAGKKRAEMLLDAAAASARKADHAFVLAWCQLSDGVVAYCLGEFRRSYESCVRAKEMFTNRCTGVAWERETADLYIILSAFYLGRLKEQGRRIDEGARHADDRGDLFASTYVRSGLAMMAWLARDDPDRALAEVAGTAERWSRRGYFLAHFWCFIARAQIDLYNGEPRRALDRVRDEWPLLSQSLMLRSVQIVRIESLHVRARAAIALAETSEDGRADLLRDAMDDAGRLASENMPYATPLAALVRAGVAAVRGQRTTAAAELTAAVSGFDAADMRSYAMIARLRRGELLGDAGDVATAEAWMREEEIRAPLRFAAMLAPGFSRGR